MHKILRLWLTRTFALLVLGTIGASAHAQSADDPPAPDPAMQHLMRMATFLSGLEAFSLQQLGAYDVVQDSGQKIAFEESRRLVFARPDHFRVETLRGDGRVSVMTCDGESVTVFSPEQNVYVDPPSGY